MVKITFQPVSAQKPDKETDGDKAPVLMPHAPSLCGVPWWPGPAMGLCGRKALTWLSSAFAACGLGLLGIAVSTDYWLHLEEGVILPLNHSAEPRMALHSGLWRVCFTAGEEKGRCFTIEDVMPTTVQRASESTVSVLKMIRSATPFPLVSLFFMFIGFVLNIVGHVRPHHTLLAHLPAIFFNFSGLSLVVGWVVYSSSANDEMYETNEAYFSSTYGWSFAAAAVSNLPAQTAGIMSMYLFKKRYKEEMYRPRLSACSDYSGQFLHPDAGPRGRSPSISSETSLQMSASYPVLITCPDYDRMSSSPC